MNRLLAIVLSVFIFCTGCREKSDVLPRTALCEVSDLELMPINHFQIIGSHNSYRKRTFQPLFNLFVLATNLIPDAWIPDEVDPAIQWDYNHLPLSSQLTEHNIRKLEIDLYYDPEGGNFYNRLGNALVGKPIASGEPALLEPGMKVLHVPHLDYMTHHLTFKESLQTLLDWSYEQPDHFPLYIMLELKNTLPVELPDLFNPFTSEGKKEIAAEILDIIPSDKMIKPSDLRTHATLYESILVNGWPTVAEARGKFIFFVLGENEIEELIFGSNGSIALNDNHIFKSLDNSLSNQDMIKKAVEMGFIVRTRADAGTIEARTGDTGPRDAAFSSGAHIISTDYYKPDNRHIVLPNQWSGYHVRWPNGHVARSNLHRDCYLD